MKNLLVPLVAGLALAGCTTLDGWSEAPGSDRYGYESAAPVGWWGQNAASVDLFYDPLSSYGRWDNVPGYGRVFLPRGVGSGWQPYSRGYWRGDSRYGRRWVSNEPFGWATYHYGRWGQDPRLGWYWVPDTRFGGSWVDWRDGNSWSPRPPYGYRGRNPWIQHDRPQTRPPRPGKDQVATPRPRPPYRIPENSHPRSKPIWQGGERQPGEQAWQGGERQPRREGWQNGERPGFNRQPPKNRAPGQPRSTQNVHPRTPPQQREAGNVAPRPTQPRAERPTQPRAERQAAPRPERQQARPQGRRESGAVVNSD